MIPAGLGFEQELFAVGDGGAVQSKKEETATSAGTGSLLKLGGEDKTLVTNRRDFQYSDSRSDLRFNYDLYAPTSSYSPVYAPTITTITESSGASVSKKDDISGGGASGASVPVSYGGFDLGDTSQGTGSVEQGANSGFLKSLANNSTGMIFVGGVVIVGGVILFSRFGNAKNLPTRRGGKK